MANMRSSSNDGALMGQFRRPIGVQGRAAAALMNKHHNLLSNWGLTYVKIGAAFTVLDVGCGGGKTIGKLGRQTVNGKVLGIDYSKDMVEYSEKENQKLVEEGRVALVQGFVEKMGFLDNFFDLVTAIETYYFWPNIPKAFQEINRVLKQGGKILIVSEMIKDGVFEVKNAEIIAKAHVKLLPMQEIECQLISAGFFNVEIFRKPGSPWNAILAQKLGN